MGDNGPVCSPDYTLIAIFICSAIIVVCAFFAYCYWQSRKEKKERRDVELRQVLINQAGEQDQTLQVQIAQQNKTINSLRSENSTYEKTCRDQQRALDKLGTISYIPTEVTDAAELNTISLIRIFLQLDRGRCNTTFTHINPEGELVNSKDPQAVKGERTFRNYWGTCSTCPLPWFRDPQYFEVKAKVDLKQPLITRDLLLEIGLARAEEQDVSHNIQGKPQTFSLNVAHCTTHNTICRNGWRHRREMQCLTQTMKNVAGHSATLHFGVLYDHSRGRVVFLDVGRARIVSVIDGVDNSAVLWPMFGVFYPDRGTISMSVVVGSDIEMTVEKKQLIMQALHERYTEY